ncbi:PASTA domain-containing protein [bacterium]|nr:PASTA domain-containing protein [bacterium]
MQKANKAQSRLIPTLKQLSIFVLTMILIVLIFDKIVMPLAVRHGQGYAVPTITGKKLEEAKQILADHDLKLVVESEKNDNLYPPGFVVTQNPQPKSVVKKNRRIYVVVSIGERQVIVPKLVGRSERDAKFLIESNRLDLENISFEHSTYYPEGVVAEQSLRDSVEVSSGTNISLVVSMGPFPNRFLVPTLAGKDMEKAIMLLQKSGLSIGRIMYQLEESLLPNTVITQSYEPNSEVPRGTAIDLIISKLQNAMQTEADTTRTNETIFEL